MGNPVVQASTSTCGLAKLNANLHSGLGFLTGFLVLLNHQRLCSFLKKGAISLSFSTSSLLEVDFRKSPQSSKP